MDGGFAHNANTLREYQRAGATWLQATTALSPHRFLIWDPGLGKTATAIRAAYDQRLKRVLVLCPAVARIVWDAELDRWWPNPFGQPRVLVIQPGVKPQTPPQTGWTICAYSNLSTLKDPWRGVLRKQHWDLVIIDECQYLKGASNRTYTVYGRRLDGGPGSLVGNADRVWLLSGTPAPNHVGELYPHISALFHQSLPREITNIYQFEDRYCNVLDTTFGRRITGSNLRNLPDLRTRLAPHVLRKRREDVLKDLPPLAFYDTPIDVPDLNFNHWGILRGTGYGDDYEDLIKKLQSDESNLATERRILGLKKATEAAKFIEELVSSMSVHHRKVVVFAYHRSVIAKLAKELADWDPVILDGATPPQQRDKNIRAFQQDTGRAHVFIGQVQAAGTAISLTAAHTAVFVEVSWVPAENYQASLRIHRLGQANACAVHFLYVPGSLDQRIMRAYRRKAGELAQLLDPKTEG